MRCHAAWTLWFLGKHDQALVRMKQALAVAGDLSEPHGVAHTLYFAAVLHHFRREPRLTQEFAEASLEVSIEHGLVLYQASAKILRGWALVEQRLQEEGIAVMREGVAAHQATGTEMARPHFLILLGEALGKAHQAEEGLHVLEEALALIHRKGEKCYLAEVYRVKGELILMRAEEEVGHSEAPAVREAEACFQQSIQIAQQQKAKSYELRTAMSLARLYQKQDQLEAARDLLAPVFSSFTEGSDTGDLCEAKALLAGLS